MTRARMRHKQTEKRICPCSKQTGHAVQELRLLFKALTKLAGNLYLVLLPLRRGVRHFTNCMIFCISHGEKPWPTRRTIIVHFIEAICVLCEMILNLMCTALSLGEALCHSIQVGFYVLAAMLRTIQLNLNRR
ncbi:unnamed protein product [Boreogadus saida]